jgi:regulator of replication initiation timing
MNSTNVDNIVSLMNRVTELEEALDRQDLVAADAWSENEKLEAENARLRKELASYRKGDCRRKIDKAMEGK